MLSSIDHRPSARKSTVVEFHGITDFALYTALDIPNNVGWLSRENEPAIIDQIVFTSFAQAHPPRPTMQSTAADRSGIPIGTGHDNANTIRPPEFLGVNRLAVVHPFSAAGAVPRNAAQDQDGIADVGPVVGLDEGHGLWPNGRNDDRSLRFPGPRFLRLGFRG
jgi:hypothetical protein